MSTYSFAIDDSTRVVVLLLSLFSGCVATFVPAIGGLYFLPNKVEQSLIKHFDYIKNTNIKIQELSKELEQKNDYLLKLNIKLYSLVTGKEITDMEYKKKQVYAFRKTFCDNSVLTNFIDDKGNKKVKRRVRVPKDN